ncbi:AAA family ATPase [Aetokthonos hydrillicola Thurmond2011]|jgi:PAS domain S-box-containing protein|uniref:AAA family ATPase n=1 Tax=Aetokthonos hydrillicola Thurmond2011 TaxID=2712845 RepID=A0AAP5ICU6_9CYAN|nr:AAA family ATPase [Aetokthonos hydrillicola]MBO3461436.1 AAA family ATPase [Aetokthonos hydrillicola CCALA 1050]MBW4588778.1 AAA family ATPase [Aetokthonos hydrillicola CCALA 1050]MDR9897358.1 AAA family ATPase [Aetokthonos hydrillicola Thurmond2011]
MIALTGVAIESKIYESSASLVYRGIRVRDNLPIIVKMLKQDYPSSQELTRYKQEYEMTRSLNIEGVVKAHSQQEYQRTLVIFLEDFGGESLERWMQKRPDFLPMPLSAFLPLAINLTDILGKIHAANVIHKDINPGNIVLNLDTGAVKIIDFGIATRFNHTNPTFKSPHVLEGTLAYVSPEQTGRMNRLLDYRTDFYSLGVTFYELLTGQLPFPTTDVLELVHCHIAKQPPPPHELNATIPKVVSDIVLKLMMKNAEDRYQSAWGVKADLEMCANQLEEVRYINSIQLGLQDVSGQFQIPQKLYGREAEIGALLAAFERLVTSEDNCNAVLQDNAQTTRESEQTGNLTFKVEMMLVSGYAGIGKSVLVQELYKPITAKRGYFIWGKFDQFQRNIPYSAIVDALQKLVRQLLGEPENQLQQWRSRLLAVLGSNGQIIIDVIPEVELIIGKQPPVPSVGATEAQNRFNRVFGQFVQVFCSKKHPLVIFLDDLQWIDSATLKLIELMLLDEQTQSLLLIGAYRDNEVNPTHPLVFMLERLRQQGAVFQEINLSPLGLEPLSQLIAETLHHNKDTVRTLAKLVLHKTEGNPFFVNEFLRLLYSENWLTFATEQQNWQWNIAQIETQNITNNVVELLLSKLKKLPEVTQQLLQLAACIGAEFDLKTLAIVDERSPKTVFQDLLTAVQADLIRPVSELDEDLLVQNYKFLHDRVQQAAYALIDESHKQVVHLQIGRNLLEKTLPEELSERLFEIVDHLNLAIDLVVSGQERNSIARLNLMAAQKAKAATAYSAAFKYAIAGIELLATDSWQHQYDLSLVLYEEAAETAYLSGDFLAMEQCVAIVLQEAKTILDEVKVHEVIIKTYVAQTHKLDAIKVGLQVLAKLGLNLPESPTELQIQQALSETEEVLLGRDIQDLAHLPLMTDASRLAAMRTISNIASPAFQAVPALFWLMACEQVKLSIQYGNAPTSPVAYSCYGVVITAATQDVEKAHQLGQLALNLVERLNAQELKCKTFLIVAEGISFGKSHFREIVSLLQESYSSGVETGDFGFAGLAAYQKCEYLYFSGLELTELEKEMENYSHAITQLKQETCLNYHQIFWQAVLNLQGQVNNPCSLQGVAYNEQQGLNRYLANNDSLGFQYFYINKLILCYLFGQFTQALNNANAAEGYLKGAPGQVTMPLFCFYDSLVRLTIYSHVPDSEQKVLFLNVSSNQEKMHKWAHHAPMNFLHKYHLVEAEKARVLGQLLEAEKLYEQAIQDARENGYIQEEALAYELAAKHYLARGLEKFAQIYMKEAHYCYERWGATAKVRNLEAHYPQFFPQSTSVNSMPIHTATGTTSNTSHVALDLATIMKASQTISSEIELERLLHALMQILIENAGAQTGSLLLENAGEWMIEATCEFIEGTQTCATKVLQSTLISNRLPESIIHYVIRTHESVILNDATREGNFINDPYIQHHQSQSVFCLPLLNQSKLIGVLYLENQLATGAFTPEQSQILSLLSTQAAISIENAKLYAKLRASESRMTQFLEAVPVGIGIIDATGRPYYANQRAIQLMGKGIDPAVLPEQISEAYQFYETGTDQIYPTEKLPAIRALGGARTTVDDIEIRQNSATIPIQVWGTPVFDEQGKVAYAIVAFEDITERKQAEKLLADYNQTLEQQITERTLRLSQEIEERQRVENALRQSEEQRRLTMDFTYIGSWSWNITENTVDWNDNFARLLGLVPGEVESSYQAWRDRVYPEDIYRVEQAITTALATHTDFEAEYRVIHPDGSIHWLVGRGRGIYDTAGQPVRMLGIILDISEQRNAALRERERAQQASILEERNRMAREIHDTLAQSFTGILLQVGAATQVLAHDPEATQLHLEMIEELARAGLAGARRSVSALRPQLLEEGNLESALHRIVAQMRSKTDTALICEIQGTAYFLPTEVENNLLRIGQEALTNAIKYAYASEIRVELVYKETHCVLRVKDNGRGFGVGSTPLMGGFGLLGMSERAEHIGAQLTIQSQPGRGTEIIVTINRE